MEPQHPKEEEEDEEEGEESPTPPSSLEIRLFYVRIFPCSPDSVPPHLNLSHLGASIEINGSRAPSSEPTPLPLRRDRIDAADATYVSTDGVRLSGAATVEVSDDRGNLILSATFERTLAGRPSSSYRDPTTGWSMGCSVASSSIGSTAFVKAGISPPSIEVYVAGRVGGSPLILTQTSVVEHNTTAKRKAARIGNLDSIPEENGEVSGKEQTEGLQRCKRASSSVMEPIHNKSQSQSYMTQTYPFQFMAHQQHHPQFIPQASQMQSQFQPQMVQFSYQVPMIPHPHYQPMLATPYSQMQSNCQPQRQSQFQSQDQPQSQDQAQLLSQTTKKGTPNKRWKPHYDDFLIPFLVEQAREGMKVDKIFKRQAFIAAATAVNDRFNELFTWENVDNHMKTLKTKYQEIKKCKEHCDTGWNDELKMIILDEATYQTYIEANPKAKDYINKPIEQYEGLKIICGDDPIIGYRKNIFQQIDMGQIAVVSKVTDARDFDQEPIVHDDEGEVLVVGSTCTEHQPTTPQGTTEAPSQAPVSPSSSRNGRTSGRTRENIEAVIMELVRKVADVADAIHNARPTHWTAELYERIMELDEFDATIQEAAFDTLCRDEAEARAFIVKNKMMRRSWLERFMVGRFSE